MKLYDFDGMFDKKLSEYITKNAGKFKEEEWEGKRKAGREKLLQVAQALLGRPVEEDAVLVGISGRYEFKNKGIDVFVDAMGQLNGDSALQKEILAFVLVPAGHGEVNKDLLHNLQQPNQAVQVGNTYLTHYLTDEANDPVMNRIRSLNLHNSVNDKVKVFFVPSYLNGDDGVFNMPYYDLLIGMDLTVYASYYEPWGYTPLESLAFKVPTLTTTLAGFGLWVKEHYNMAHPGIEVVRRGDNDNAKVITAIAEWVRNYTVADGQTRMLWRQNAKSVSQIALWDNLITYYRQAYSFALEQVDCRLKNMQVPAEESVSYIEKQLTVNNPSWVSVMIHRSIPEKLGALEELCQNLWWCWHDEARELFRMVDADVWRKCGHNPIALLDSISLNRYQELENDSEFVNKLNEVYGQFRNYMALKDHMSGDGVAYFSMEYGLNHVLKIYSGGLGVLAGDYLKEASDSNVDLCAVGFLYRYGYFTQTLSMDGQQIANYEAQNFGQLPIDRVLDENGNQVIVDVPYLDYYVHAYIWRVNVGRISLYLLDTDNELNSEFDHANHGRVNCAGSSQWKPSCMTLQPASVSRSLEKPAFCP